MKKITLRTKITLTIVGLLALTGIFYAANPSPFATVHHAPSKHGGSDQPEANPAPFAIVPVPVGVAAAPDQLLVSEYSSQNLDTIDCLGTVSVLATIPKLRAAGLAPSSISK